MWGADDSAAGEIAKRFYENLREGLDKTGFIKEGLVAVVLREAITLFKTYGPKGQDVLMWGPFVHLGA